MVEGIVKYLVQVQCQPSPIDCAEQVFQAVSHSFNVTRYSCDGPELTLEVQSDHPLAYGAFKDLADLVKQTLNQHHRRLRYGAIHQVERHPLSAVLEAFNPGSFWQRTVERLLGGPRLSLVMYFYGGVCIDLVLSAKARRLSMQAAPEPN